MALIGTIRKNNWLLLIMIGLGLVAFLFMDSFSNQSMGAGAAGPVIGNVAGTDIAYNDFRKVESIYYGNSANQYETQGRVWDYFVEKAIINQEADQLGINVSREELRDLQFGTQLSPIIQANFRNQQTGQIDRARLNEVKNAIDDETFENQDYRAFWAEQEHQIVKNQKQNKINALVSKAMFTPTFMCEQQSIENGSTANFDFVKVPFDKIADTEVEVSDAAIASYLKENASMYTNDVETRQTNFVVFDVVPTAPDSLICKQQIEAKINVFANNVDARQDSLFAINNNGNFTNFYAQKSDLPEYLSKVITNLEVGQVSAPIAEGNYYIAAKLVDRAIVPDSVKARHILRSTTSGSVTELGSARLLIDSIKTELEKGSANFSDMAKAHSQDPGSGAKGGELGYFAQGAMVPEFNEVAMFGDRGKYHVVESQFGVHLIDVQDKKYLNRDNKYKVALIRIPIIPSQNTQDSVFNYVANLVSTNKTIETLKTTVQTEGKTLETSAYLAGDGHNINGLGSSSSTRNIVQWLFDSDTEMGEVSPDVYTFTDQALYYNNKYVIAGLSGISEKGLRSVAAARNDVEILVKNKLKGEKLKSQITDNSLAAVAAKFGLETSNVANAALGTSNVTGLGNEPKVMQAALASAENTNVGPIIGNSGVYVLNLTQKNMQTEATNIPILRSSTTQAVRSSVPGSLISALKKVFTVEDTRNLVDM